MNLILHTLFGRFSVPMDLSVSVLKTAPGHSDVGKELLLSCPVKMKVPVHGPRTKDLVKSGFAFASRK